MRATYFVWNSLVSPLNTTSQFGLATRQVLRATGGSGSWMGHADVRYRRAKGSRWNRESCPFQEMLPCRNVIQSVCILQFFPNFKNLNYYVKASGFKCWSVKFLKQLCTKVQHQEDMWLSGHEFNLCHMLSLMPLDVYRALIFSKRGCSSLI